MYISETQLGCSLQLHLVNVHRKNASFVLEARSVFDGLHADQVKSLQELWRSVARRRLNCCPSPQWWVSKSLSGTFLAQAKAYVCIFRQDVTVNKTSAHPLCRSSHVCASAERMPCFHRWPLRRSYLPEGSRDSDICADHETPPPPSPADMNVTCTPPIPRSRTRSPVSLLCLIVPVCSDPSSQGAPVSPTCLVRMHDRRI